MRTTWQKVSTWYALHASSHTPCHVRGVAQFCAVLVCFYAAAAADAGYVSRGALFKATSDALPAMAAANELWSSGVVSGELQVGKRSGAKHKGSSTLEAGATMTKSCLQGWQRQGKQRKTARVTYVARISVY
jgi:hypothetical protein